ncbi:MAG: MMPL family transporter, partial [Microcoleus sp. SIO2G3]|nr:MMPL family transporter [Microcoleus sp. SIO2G3]
WSLSMRRALRGTWQPVTASGATVILGLLCLLLSDLNIESEQLDRQD